MRVISMRDIIGAARSFGGADGLSYSDNWDSMSMVDLDEALEGAGVAKAREADRPSIDIIPVPVSAARQVRKPSGLLSRGVRG